MAAAAKVPNTARPRDEFAAWLKGAPSPSGLTYVALVSEGLAILERRPRDSNPFTEDDLALLSAIGAEFVAAAERINRRWRGAIARCGREQASAFAAAALLWRQAGA